ncbi:hypothetical protein GBA52_014483 [Prunus armeniaca]|nr:hypothetical protein GBA52_014483 [Prunus armeniaca]
MAKPKLCHLLCQITISWMTETNPYHFMFCPFNGVKVRGRVARKLRFFCMELLMMGFRRYISML